MRRSCVRACMLVYTTMPTPRNNAIHTECFKHRVIPLLANPPREFKKRPFFPDETRSTDICQCAFIAFFFLFVAFFFFLISPRKSFLI